MTGIQLPNGDQQRHLTHFCLDGWTDFKTSASWRKANVCSWRLPAIPPESSPLPDGPIRWTDFARLREC